MKMSDLDAGRIQCYGCKTIFHYSDLQIVGDGPKSRALCDDCAAVLVVRIAKAMQEQNNA